MEVSLAILAIGGLIFFAHIFAAVFDRLGIPDILPLMIVGLILGPGMGLVSPEAFGKVGPVFSTIALVAILFESGLELKLADLKAHLLSSVAATFLSYAMAIAIVALVSVFFLHMPLPDGILLGVIVGGISAAVVIPMLSKLKVTKNLKVALTLEASIGDVLCIIGTLAMLKMLSTGSLEPVAVAGNLIASLVLATVIGLAAGVFWAYSLNFFHQLENAVLTTPAFLFILYAVTEMLGYSGPIAALSFGVLLGNVKQIKLPSVGSLLGIKDKDPADIKSPVAGSLIKVGGFFVRKDPVHSAMEDSDGYESLASAKARDLNFLDRVVISELIFIVKTFFFVYLGLSIKLDNQTQILAGVLLTFWIYLVRIVSTRMSLSPKQERNDALISSIMCPKGLAAAVLASMPVSAGLAYGATIQNLSYSIILASTILTTILLVVMRLDIPLPPYCFVFNDYKKSTVAGEVS